MATNANPSMQEGYDLNLGESRESTTLYGLKFVDMLRKTQDKRCARFPL